MSKKDKAMIDVYSWATPNGHKIHIMLEECGYRFDRDWRAIPIDIGKGDQFKPEFLTIRSLPLLIRMALMANRSTSLNPAPSCCT